MNKYDDDFEKLLGKINELYYAKNDDYNDGDKWSNFDACNRIDIPTAKGIVVRMTDKFNRILTLVRKRYKGIEASVSDEKLEDTLEDLAVYSLITILALKREDN